MTEYDFPTESIWIDSFCKQINELKEKYTELDLVDLVVEGGVGKGSRMKQVIARTFPKALYVGMDLLSIDSQISQEREIEQPILEGLINKRLNVILANCFDFDLVKDIAQKSGKTHPLLFSVNSLAALSDCFLPGDWQKHQDYVPVEEWFESNVPYLAQIHLYRESNVWDLVSRGISPCDFATVENTAKTSGYKIERLPSGLAIIK